MKRNVIEITVICKVEQAKRKEKMRRFLLKKEIIILLFLEKHKKKPVIELIEQKKANIRQHTHFIRFRGRWNEGGL